MNWYYAVDGKSFGPFSDEAFRQAVSDGRVAPDTLVWAEGMAQWLPFSAVGASLGGGGAASGFAGAQESGIPMPAAMPYAYAYAGFWVRFVAVFIDGLLLAVVNMVLSVLLAATHGVGRGEAAAAAQTLLFIVELAIGMTYETFFVGRYGATLGKMALGLRVIRPNGSPVSYWLAFGRYWGKQLSGLILCIGYIMAGFDEEKRALHDRICETRVIRK